MKKHTTTLAVFTCTFALLGAAPALGSGSFFTGPAILAPDLESVSGEIKRVDLEKKQFVLAPIGKEDMTITVSESTTFTLDGKPSTMKEALVNGHSATVQHEKGGASRVDVRSKK